MKPDDLTLLGLARSALKERHFAAPLMAALHAGQRLLSNDEAGIILRFMTGRLLLADAVVREMEGDDA